LWAFTEVRAAGAVWAKLVPAVFRAKAARRSKVFFMGK
jgi:hypothetical protein